MKKIYIDVCCLNRPFDDQTQDRIRLEAEAILLILQHLESKEWQWFSSVVVDYEINQTPNLERRSRVKQLAAGSHKIIRLNNSITERGEIIKGMGFKTYDALHIACAEDGQADIFLSTDDKLLKLGAQYAKKLKVHIQNPLRWFEEVMK